MTSGDPLAGVGHDDAATPARLALDGKRHPPAARGELDRVAQQVPRHLLQALFIAHHPAWIIHDEIDADAFGFSGWLHRVVGTVRLRRHLALDGLHAVPVLAARLLPAGPPPVPAQAVPARAGGLR